MTATIMFSNFGGFRCSQVLFVVLEVDVGLWLGTEGGLWLEVHLFVMLV